jgi:hypothetical protein
MKTFRLFALFVLLLGWAQHGHGQQISYRKEKITVNGKLYAYLDKTGSVWARTYSLKNLQNQELAAAKATAKILPDGLEYVYYEVSFKGYPQKAEMEDSNDFGRRLALELAAIQILQNDTLNPQAIHTFLAKYPPNISRRLDAIPAPYQPEPRHNRKQNMQNAEGEEDEETDVPVKKKDRKMQTDSISSNGQATGKKLEIPVLNPVPAVTTATPGASGKTTSVPEIALSGSLILKGPEKIGRYSETRTDWNGKIRNVLIFYNSANLEVARAGFTGPEKNACQVLTSKDRKNRTLKIGPEKEPVKFLAEWLVQNNYL